MDPPSQQSYLPSPPIASLESPMGDGQLFTPHASSWQGQGQGWVPCLLEVRGRDRE